MGSSYGQEATGDRDEVTICSDDKANSCNNCISAHYWDHCWMNYMKKDDLWTVIKYSGCFTVTPSRYTTPHLYPIHMLNAWSTQLNIRIIHQYLFLFLHPRSLLEAKFHVVFASTEQPHSSYVLRLFSILIIMLHIYHQNIIYYLNVLSIILINWRI